VHAFFWGLQSVGLVFVFLQSICIVINNGGLARSWRPRQRGGLAALSLA